MQIRSFLLLRLFSHVQPFRKEVKKLVRLIESHRSLYVPHKSMLFSMGRVVGCWTSVAGGGLKDVFWSPEIVLARETGI